MSPLPTPVLIFDFDGTIADTFTPTMTILEADYRRWGDKFTKTHTINQLRSLTIKEIIKTIPGGWWKFVYLLLKTKAQIKKNLHQVSAYPGIVYTLRTLYEQGFALIIVTSNESATVKQFLRRYNLSDIFINIYETKGLFQKARRLQKVLQKYQLKPKQAYYIGDEIRDIQACQKIALPIISVSYGFNSYPGLKRFRPTHLIKKPTQLLALLEKVTPKK